MGGINVVSTLLSKFFSTEPFQYMGLTLEWYAAAQTEVRCSSKD